MFTVSISDEFDQYIRPINQMINPFRMQITKGLDEETGHAYYAVVNLVDNHLSRLFCLYTQEQLNVIRRALDMIITSPRCMFSAKRLIARCYELGTKMTPATIRQLLSDLVNQQFLTRVDNHYTLGIRGCIEMEPYYLINYTSMVEVCNTCKVFCVRGEHCASCDIKLHFPCLNRCISELQGACPGCSQQWKSRADPLADEGSDDETVPLSQSQIMSTQVVSDNEEDERPIISRANRRRSQMETEDSPPSTAASQPRSKARRIKSANDDTSQQPEERVNWKRGRQVSSESESD